MNMIGLDIGTTSLCGILCDAATGELRRSVTRPNDTFLPTAHPWEKQQDPVVLMARLQEIAAELSAEGPVAAIGVTGQMHGIVYLTAEGKPVLLLGQVWDNPRPDVAIASISYTADKKDYAVLLSAGVLGVKLDK